MFIANAEGNMEKVLPGEVIKMDDNTVKIVFPEPIAGEATVS